MNDSKGQTIFLSVIGIATLLVAIVGATFAWFSASVTGNEDASSILVTTAKVAGVTFKDGSVITTSSALPGWSASKTFTVYHPGGNTVNQVIDVKLNWIHTQANEGKTVATDLTYTLTEAEATALEATGYTPNPTDYTAGTITDPVVGIGTERTAYGTGDIIATKTITGTEANPGKPWASTYTFTVTFPENYTDQNAQQGAVFSGYLSVELDKGTGTMYYNNAAPNGTNVLPTAPEGGE